MSIRANDQRAIIEQLLGITILTEKADSLKEQIRNTKDSITQETLKINAIEASNEKIQTTINNLGNNQRAWSAKKTQDINKLKNIIMFMRLVKLHLVVIQLLP